MDKSRNVRRVLSRCSVRNRINNETKLVISELSGSEAVFTAKSRREKLRRLSLVGRGGGGGGCEDGQDTEMGSDGQDEFPSRVVSAKKMKPHKKIFEDSSGVDRASIPRKLRSVIKKRTCHAISHPLTDTQNHVNGLDTTRKDCVKKPKFGVFNPEQMSKDEEEVAATLYALAGTAPRKVTSLGNKSDSESPSESQMHSKKLDDSLLSSQGPQTPEDAAEETSNQTSEELSKQKMNVDDLGNSNQPKLSKTIIQQNLNASLQVNHQSLAKTSSGTKKNDFEQREALPSQRVPENSYVIPQTVDLASQYQRGHASTESKNGSILMPSLYSQASHGAGGVDGFPSQFSATKLPNWLHSVPSSSEPGLHQSQASHKNDSEVENHNRRSVKSCPTHVYISRFIQLSQKAEGKENALLDTRQFRPSKGVTVGVLKASGHLNPVSNESTPMIPDSNMCSSFPEKNILEASNDKIMMPGRLSHGQFELASLALGNSTMRKQCFDFLSLTTGGGGTQPKIESNRNGTQLNPLAGLPVPQLQSLTRYDSIASIPLPPNLIQQSSYQNQRSTSAQPQPPIPQVHLQLPCYFSRSHQLDNSATSITKQPQLNPQSPQQHPIWMTQPGPQHRVGTMAPPQIAHWQGSRQEPYIVQYTQAQTPPSLSSLAPGTNFPKYLQMPHQHQMLRIAPFPPIQANSQHSPVSVCFDKTES